MTIEEIQNILQTEYDKRMIKKLNDTILLDGGKPVTYEAVKSAMDMFGESTNPKFERGQDEN